MTNEIIRTNNGQDEPQEEKPSLDEESPSTVEKAPGGEVAVPASASAEPDQRREALSPRKKPRWPLAAALLNLTGLGLGYLFMKRWVRWLIHLLLTVGLVTTAFLTNGAGSPKLWVAIFCLWLLWMAFDGWRQARRLAQAAPAGAAGRRWLPVAVAVLVLVLEAVGVWGYTALGRRTFAQGMDAYRDADCWTAIQRFNRVTTLYELTLSPNVAAADAGIVECSVLVFAENSKEQSQYPQAVDGYRTYLDLYPESLLTAFARDALAETYGEWATDLRQEEDYQAAIETYQVVLSDYPETATGKEAAGLAADTYAEWSTQLEEAGKYSAAIEKHLVVLDEYPDTQAGKRAATLAAEIYMEWATHLRAEKKYEEAIAKYDTVLGDYRGTPSAAQAGANAAEAYDEWATQLQSDDDYEAAVEKYRMIVSEYPDTPTAAGTREKIAKAYKEWAAQLRDEGDFEATVTRYNTILSEYADTPAAAEIEETAAIAETYAEWAAQLRETGLYAVAITKYQAILGEYPDSQPAEEAQAAIGQTYNDWGRQLDSQRKYTEAMSKFELAQEATDDSDVLVAAEKGYSDALWNLSQDRTGEGQEVMELALPAVCDGKPAESPAVGLAEDEPGKALLEGNKFKLPSDLKANSPGHFRYAICVETGTSVLQRCPYTGGHTLVRQRRWWRVRVRDTRTARVVADRTFYGSSPGSCPFSRMFSGSVDYSTGNSPSSDGIVDWLQGVVR